MIESGTVKFSDLQKLVQRLDQSGDSDYTRAERRYALADAKRIALELIHECEMQDAERAAREDA